MEREFDSRFKEYQRQYSSPISFWALISPNDQRSLNRGQFSSPLVPKVLPDHGERGTAGTVGNPET